MYNGCDGIPDVRPGRCSSCSKASTARAPPPRPSAWWPAPERTRPAGPGHARAQHRPRRPPAAGDAARRASPPAAGQPVDGRHHGPAVRRRSPRSPAAGDRAGAGRAASDVVSDRYLLSSLAYQAEEADRAWVAELARGVRTPDLTILLDVPMDGGRPPPSRRRAHRRTLRRRFGPGAAWPRNYRELARPAPNVQVLDGSGDLETVAGAIARRRRRVSVDDAGARTGPLALVGWSLLAACASAGGAGATRRRPAPAEGTPPAGHRGGGGPPRGGPGVGASRPPRPAPATAPICSEFVRPGGAAPGGGGARGGPRPGPVAVPGAGDARAQGPQVHGLADQPAVPGRSLLPGGRPAARRRGHPGQRRLAGEARSGQPGVPGAADGAGAGGRAAAPGGSRGACP